MKWDEISAEQCSVARASAVLGDRWTLVILSDAFLGVRRFEDFEERLGISRTTLANRLKNLVHHGVLQRKKYQDNPARYEYRFTDKGRDLYPVITTILNWGDTYCSDEAGPPILRKHISCGLDMLPVLTCPECKEEVTARDVQARARPPHDRFPPILRGPMTAKD